MKFEKKLLIPFTGKAPEREVNQKWPVGSEFLKLLTLPHGIYSCFLVPQKENLLTRDYTFIVDFDNIDSEKDTFVDAITTLITLPKEEGKEGEQNVPRQSVVIFPIFRRF